MIFPLYYISYKITTFLDKLSNYMLFNSITSLESFSTTDLNPAESFGNCDHAANMSSKFKVFVSPYRHFYCKKS